MIGTISEERRERHTEWKRQYRLDHPEYCLRQLESQKTPEYRYQNAKIKCESRFLNPEKYRVRERVYRQTHPAVMANKTRRWRLNNPDKFRLSQRLAQAKRNAAIANASISDFSKQDWLNLLEEYNYSCAYCGKNEPLTIDHVVPLSLGGLHTKDNIVPACGRCNSSKWNKPVEEFKERLGIFN